MTNNKIQTCRTAAYCRLSREDGDRPESDSIGNQKAMLSEYIRMHPDLELHDFYVDDGFTGTNFHRPAFQQLLQDIKAGKLQCVLVKDLSRFGRDYIDTGRYLERWLPEHNVRFIAINDGIDSAHGPYDMLLPVKNVFNAQYAKDISQKVRSAFRVKQKRGDFVGAFSCYGYLKSPANHNKLVIDPNTAPIVQRIFSLYENGAGKVRIAKILNEDGIPCPAEYKKLMGLKYNNGIKIGDTTYWTYATIHYILDNRMYAGDMQQQRYVRAMMHGKAKKAVKENWIVVENTHDPIIEPEQWTRVQNLLKNKTRSLNFEENISHFAGFLKCGDCGRSMAKTRSKGKVHYNCGSYKRYGASVCTSHYIAEEVLEQIILNDLNQVIASIADLKALAEKSAPENSSADFAKPGMERLQLSLSRVARLKKGSYEDYKDGLISSADYLQYRADYEKQEITLREQLDKLNTRRERRSIWDRPWLKSLLECGQLVALDRITIGETIKEIRIFDGGRIEITYLFSEELRALLEK